MLKARINLLLQSDFCLSMWKHTTQNGESIDPFALDFIAGQPSITKSKNQESAKNSTRQCKIDAASAVTSLPELSFVSTISLK